MEPLSLSAEATGKLDWQPRCALIWLPFFRNFLLARWITESSGGRGRRILLVCRYRICACLLRIGTEVSMTGRLAVAKAWSLSRTRYSRRRRSCLDRVWEVAR